jgi:hypothetical protein
MNNAAGVLPNLEGLNPGDTLCDTKAARFNGCVCQAVLDRNSLSNTLPAMPDWHRIIVGDAFKLPSRSVNYYRDVFLMWPILLFSLSAILKILTPDSPADRIYGLKLAACAIVAILLAKEKLILIAGGAAFVAIRLAVALAFTQDWRAYLAGLLVSVGIVIAVLLVPRRWKPSYYETPVKTNVLGLAVAVAGLGSAIVLCLLLKP